MTSGPLFTGPVDDRHRYRVDDGSVSKASRVFHAVSSRESATSGPFALKQLGAVDDATEHRERDHLRLLRSVSHPNLCVAIEVFRGPGLFSGDTPLDSECDVLYWVNSWVDGDSLWARRATIEPESAGRVVRQIGEGLAAIHAAGLVHGDLHPGNVILSGNNAILIDLDTVTRADDLEAPRSLGAIGFTPPEIADGARSSSASDGWQLAMLTVQMLLGHPTGRDHTGSLRRELKPILGRPGIRAADLLSTMLIDDPNLRPPDVVAWASDMQSALRATRRSPRRLAIAAITVAAIAVGGGLAAERLVGSDSDGSRPSATNTTARSTSAQQPTSTDAVEVTSDPQCTTEPDLTMATAEDSARLTADYESLFQAGVPVCFSPPEKFVSALVVPYDKTGVGDGVVLLGPGGPPVRLTATEWQSYREIAGRERPENAADVGGYPLSIDRENPDGETLIELSAGGIMIAPSSADQAFWIPRPLRRFWDEAGGLDGDFGFPASNPYFFEGRLVQDFEFVQIQTAPDAVYRADDQIEFTIVRPDDRSEPLRSLPPTAGHIVRQRSGVAWFVDGDGIRHWIPDGDTYFCVGGDDALLEPDVPGWAMWTLTLGPPAQCP